MAAVTLTSQFATAGPATWVCPPGVTSVQAACTGAGGGGGGAANASHANGGGGGGGEAALEPAVAVTPGKSYLVAVGAGGLGGQPGLNGADGSLSSFTGDLATVTANGGKGGVASTSGSGLAGAGGSGSTNLVSAAGGPGGGGATTPGSGWALVQQSAAQTNTNTNTLPAPSSPGNLLIAVTGGASGTSIAAADPNWGSPLTILNGAVNQTAIFAYFNNPGGLSSFTFTGPATIEVSILEFTCPGVSTVTSANALGTATAGAVASIVIATNQGTPLGGDLVILGAFEHLAAASVITWTDPAGFTEAAGLLVGNVANHCYGAYQLSAAAGVVSATVTSSVASTLTTGWTGAVATFTLPTALGAGGGGGAGAAGVSPAAGFPGNSAALAVPGAASGGQFPGGAGGAGVVATSSGAGSSGAAPGGGGGGAFSVASGGFAGGNGADGNVTLTYTMNDPVTLAASTSGSITSYTAPPGATSVLAQAWGGGARGWPAPVIAAGTPLVGAGNMVGATLNPNVYGLTSYVAGANTLNGYVSNATAPAAPRAPGLTIQKWYFGAGSPTTVAGLPQGLKDLAAAGCKILACFKPPQALTIASVTNFVATMKAMITAGISYDAILWQECTDNWFPSAAAYIAYVNYYWTTVDPVSGVAANSLGIGLVYDPGFSAGQTNVTAFYPGGPKTGGPCNGIVCDYYCVSGWTNSAGNNLPGIVPNHPLDPVAALADNDGIPFGLGEWGVTATPVPPATLFSSGGWANYCNYLINFFKNRTNRYALVYYGSAHNTTFNVVTGATDPRAVQLAAVWDALTTGGAAASAAGGGGGEFAQESVLLVTGGKTYPVAVGTGGTPASSNGGNTTIAGDSVTVTAHGGLAATVAGTGGLGGTGSANTTHRNGGNGGGGGVASGGGGGGGGSGGTAAAGNNGAAGTAGAGGAGAAAVTGGGPGGPGGGPAANGLPPAVLPGGGGGGRGAAGTLNGGGADGQVTIGPFVIGSTVTSQASFALAGGATQAMAFAGTGAVAQTAGFALAGGQAQALKLAVTGSVCDFTNVQAAAIVTGTTSVTLTCAATAAGNLLVAYLVSNTATALTGPAGWTRLATQAVGGATAGHAEAWFCNPNGDGKTGTNAGGITSAAFTGGVGDTLAGHILEFKPPAGYVALLDGTPGTASGAGPVTSIGPVSESPGPVQGATIGIALFENRFSASQSGSWTAPAGWTLGKAGSASVNWQASYYNCLAAGAQSATATASLSTNETGWAGILFAFGITPAGSATGVFALAGGQASALGFSGTGTSAVSAGTVATSGGLLLGAPSGLAFTSPSVATTFPASPLPIKAEILINGTWADISDRVYQRNGIVISGRGRPNEAAAAQPAQCALTLNNRTGDFSPQNPAGLYFPYLARNTLLRVSVQNAVTPQGAWYTGYRFHGEVPAWPVQWDPSGTDVNVPLTAVGILQRLSQSKFSASAVYRYYHALTGGLVPAGYWTCEDGTQASSFSSGLPGGSAMTWGATAPTLSADSSTAGSAPFAQLSSSSWTGVPGAFSSGGQVFATPGTFQWVCPAGITSIKAECWGGGGGGASGNHTSGNGGGGGEYAQEPSLAVTPGKTYTIVVGAGGAGGGGTFATSGAAGSDGASSMISGDTASVVGHGGKGAPTGGAAAGGSGSTNTVHFNGGAGANSGSGFGGGGGGGSAGTGAAGNSGSSNVATTGGAGGTARPGGGPGGTGGNGALASAGNVGTPGNIPSPGPGGGGGGGGFNGGNNYGKPGGGGQAGQVQISFGAQVPTPSANVLRAIVDVPTAGGVDGAYLVQALISGTVADLHIRYRTGGNFELRGLSATGAQLFTSGSQGFAANGRAMMVSGELIQTKPNVITWYLRAILPNATADLHTFTGVIAGTLGSCTSVKTNSGSALETAATGIGHPSIQYQLDPLVNLGPALGAYAGELAAARMKRLCAANDIPFRLYGAIADTPAMGPQPVALLVTILQDCENADLGQLFETRDVFGLGYHTRVSMQNQAPQVVLDYTKAPLAQGLMPTNDELLTRNDVIATRGSTASVAAGGGTFEAVLSTGALSTQDPPNGVGLYQYSVTVNLNADSQLQNFATWVLTLGTLDEFRYPVITLDLTRTEVADGTFGQIAGLDITSFLQITNPPSWLPPYPINQLALGFTETLNALTWTIAVNAVPEDPWSGTTFPTW